MKVMTKSTRERVYNAPILPYDTNTYAPISNKEIMNLMDEKIREMNLTIRNEEYQATVSNEGYIKGVIGRYYITTPSSEFGQQVMFRNSYDKSMSFAFVAGAMVWICTNGCISGDYEYKRIHKCSFDGNVGATVDDVMFNINSGFNALQESFDHIVTQMDRLKYFELGPTDTYNILGELFFDKEILSINQMSTVKRELQKSHNFKHLGDDGYSAYDLYNHCTEALKSSHPTTYISDHTTLHKLFETTFGV